MRCGQIGNLRQETFFVVGGSWALPYKVILVEAHESDLRPDWNESITPSPPPKKGGRGMVFNCSVLLA